MNRPEPAGVPQRQTRDPVAKAFQLLMRIAEEDYSWGVRELAADIGSPPSTTHRVLASLVELDVLREENGRYRVGPEAQRLARLVGFGQPDLGSAEAALRQLTQETGESSILGVADLDHDRYRLERVVNSTHPLRYVHPLFEWTPVHIGAVGIAILSGLDDATRDAHLESSLKAYTEETPTDPRLVDEAARVARRQGWALTRGQKLPGALGIAAPIHALQSGQVVVAGAVSLTIPEPRFDYQDLQKLHTAVRACATSISERWGAPSES